MRPFRHPAFRYLWLALSASALGDSMVVVALALFVSKHGGPRDVSLVLAANTGSLMICLLVGGVWADRLPRRRVMLFSDLARGLLHGTLAAMILAGVADVWQVIVIELCFGAAEAFFRPAHAGFLPQTVPSSLIHDAWAATSIAYNSAELLGPALATALIVSAGPGPALAVDGAFYVVSALLLTRTRTRVSSEQPPPAAERPGMVRELREGFQAVRKRAWAWTGVAVFAIGGPALFAPWWTLGPSVANARYGSAGAFGLFVALTGAGRFAGTLLSLRWRPLYPLRAGYLALLPGLLAIPAFATGASLWLALPFAFVWGAGESLCDINWWAMLAQRMPGELLSRVTAFEWIGSMALMPLGLVIAGTLAEQFGRTPVLLAGVAVYGAATLTGLAVPETWRLRRVESDAESDRRQPEPNPQHP